MLHYNNDEVISQNIPEDSSKTVFNITAKKSKREKAESEEETSFEETLKPSVVDESSINFVSKKDIGTFVEKYREVEKNVQNSPKKDDELIPTNKKKGKKSGWWQRLLKPTSHERKNKVE